MNIELTHPFLFQCVDPHKLIGETTKFDKFSSVLMKQAVQWGGQDPERQDTYKGNGFEIFVEALIKLNETDQRIGIKNYAIVDASDDFGVDGVGVGNNGKVTTVQAKFRHATYTLTQNEDHLANFVCESILGHSVDVSEDGSVKNMVIITSGKEVHYRTLERAFRNKVRVLARKEIQKLVDNNQHFWDSFYNSFIESRNPQPAP